MTRHAKTINTEQEILRFFAARPNRKLKMTEVSRLTGIAVDVLKRHLFTLTGDEVLKSEVVPDPADPASQYTHYWMTHPQAKIQAEKIDQARRDYKDRVTLTELGLNDVDPDTIPGKIKFLEGLRDRTIYGDSALLKNILGDYYRIRSLNSRRGEVGKRAA